MRGRLAFITSGYITLTNKEHPVNLIIHSHGVLGHFDFLAALWRFPLEHVAVVGSGGGGIFRQWGAGAQL